MRKKAIEPIVSDEVLRARRALNEFAPERKTKPKKNGKTIPDALFERKLEEVGRMLRDGKWEEATPIHFVALYVDLFYRVYGTLPLDLGPKDRVLACKIAGSMLQRNFGGDRLKMSRFMAWTWTTEKQTEAWRRENGRDGGMIGWQYQFSNKLMTKYRVAEARKSAHR